MSTQSLPVSNEPSESSLFQPPFLNKSDKETQVRAALTKHLKDFIATRQKLRKENLESLSASDSISTNASPVNIHINASGQRVFATPPPSLESLKKVRKYVQFRNASSLILNTLRYEASQIEDKKYQEKLQLKEVDREQHLIHNYFIRAKLATENKNSNSVSDKNSNSNISGKNKTLLDKLLIQPQDSYASALNNNLSSNLQYQRLLSTQLHTNNSFCANPPAYFSTTTTFYDNLTPPPSVNPARHKRFPYSDYAHILTTQLDRSLYPQFLPPTFSPSSPSAQKAQILFQKSLIASDIESQSSNINQFVFSYSFQYHLFYIFPGSFIFYFLQKPNH